MPEFLEKWQRYRGLFGRAAFTRIVQPRANLRVQMRVETIKLLFGGGGELDEKVEL